MVALPFRRVLTTVRTTPVLPTPHPVHPSRPCSNQQMHKTMCPNPAIMIQSNPADPIQPIQRYDPDPIQTHQYNPADTIQPANTIRSEFSTKQKIQPRPIISCLTASASSYTTYPADPPSSAYPICYHDISKTQKTDANLKQKLVSHKDYTLNTFCGGDQNHRLI